LSRPPFFAWKQRRIRRRSAPARRRAERRIAQLRLGKPSFAPPSSVTQLSKICAHEVPRSAEGRRRLPAIALSNLRQIFNRPRDPKQSTDFSFSRFLTPYLAGFTGWALYMDCDMVMLDDVANLWRLRDEAYALMCVQHHHAPKEGAKFLRHAQIPYARKNWSSVMLMNCSACNALTPEYVATASGLELHQFKWRRIIRSARCPRAGIIW
jgi:hypothetical protein